MERTPPGCARPPRWSPPPRGTGPGSVAFPRRCRCSAGAAPAPPPVPVGAEAALPPLQAAARCWARRKRAGSRRWWVVKYRGAGGGGAASAAPGFCLPVLFGEGAAGEAQGLSARSRGLAGFPVMQTWSPSGLSVKLLCRGAFFACCTQGGTDLLLVAALRRLRGNPQAVLRHWVLNRSLGLLPSLGTRSFP